MSAGTWPTRQTGTVTPPTGGAAACAYDAPGRITTKTTGASIDTHSYLGSTETAWQIVNTGGSGITTKGALDATGARTAVTNGSLTGYLGFDLHGNTALAENASRVITDALRYHAWGETAATMHRDQHDGFIVPRNLEPPQARRRRSMIETARSRSPTIS